MVQGKVIVMAFNHVSLVRFQRHSRNDGSAEINEAEANIPQGEVHLAPAFVESFSQYPALGE